MGKAIRPSTRPPNREFSQLAVEWSGDNATGQDCKTQPGFSVLGFRVLGFRA